jgi:hypothetical protein
MGHAKVWWASGYLRTPLRLYPDSMSTHQAEGCALSLGKPADVANRGGKGVIRFKIVLMLMRERQASR